MHVQHPAGRGAQRRAPLDREEAGLAPLQRHDALGRGAFGESQQEVIEQRHWVKRANVGMNHQQEA